MQQVYHEVLNRKDVGIYDNFFEVGGHSLLATQVVARLRRLMEVEVPLRALFESPTVVSLADRIAQEMRQERGFTLPPLLPAVRSEKSLLSFAQQRLWFLNQIDPQGTAYNIADAVRLRGELKQVALEQALARVARRHETLRTTFITQDGQPLQCISEESTIQLVTLDLSGLPQPEREAMARLLAQQEVEQPFDLAHGPLLRCWLLPLSQEEQILVLSMHHIVTDGWSMSILVRELNSLYQAILRGEETALTELPIQYADYALWQRQWLQGEILQQQMGYWKQQLADLTPLQLPTDYPRPAIQTYRGARLHLRLPSALTQQVQALARQEGVTLFMLLLAVFQVLLARYSGQEDIVIGTTIANRNQQEVENLIGF
ncbi:MAG TPA: condensation domain-containing protein, partial [Ktedonobacteraceae bacterium]|nr:condensation domain-containing protein [Ktedonobacteraceae bacterium]